MWADNQPFGKQTPSFTDVHVVGQLRDGFHFHEPDVVAEITDVLLEVTSADEFAGHRSPPACHI